MAERIVTVQPSGGDYTTLAAAVSGERTANSDLTTDNGSGTSGPLIIEVRGTWSSYDTAAVTTNGFTLDATNYLEIRPDSANAAGTSWDSSKYGLVVDGATAITNNDPYVRIVGLQIWGTGTGTWVLNVADWDTGTSDIRIQKCYIRGDGTTNAKVGIEGYDANPQPTILIENCIIYDCDVSLKLLDGTFTVYHTVIYGTGSSTYGISIASDSNSAIITNCVVANNADDITDSGAVATIDHCATDDADGTNAVAPINSTWSDEFDGPATGDFTLKNTGNLHEGGTAITGGPSTDIEGDSWGSPPSIGADEYTSSVDALTGDDIATGAVAVETPSIGQVHALVRTDISTGVVVVEEGALGQTHALVGSDVSLGALVVGTPTAGEVINGTVEYNGSACNGATVDVIDDSSDTLVATATTNVSGEYTLTLNAGTYRVSWTWYDSGDSSWKGKASVIVYGS